MSELIREIEIWFGQRPMWLQDSARRLIQNGALTATDLKELIELCKAEAGLIKTEIKPLAISPGSLLAKEEKTSLRLNFITNIKGVNALGPRKPLSFSNGSMTIIYGQNGSGKSSYVRILKHMCGARNPGKLLGNVFNKTTSEQGCTINITNDSGSRDIDWNPDMGVHEELRLIELYDSECANVYVNEENEVAYEPWVLLLFSQLTEVCTKVGQALKDEADQNVSKNPKIPDGFNTTEAGVWYNKLNSKTKELEIISKCKWTQELETELNQKNQRIAEANPAEKAKNLRKIIGNVEGFSSNLVKLKKNLDDQKCMVFLSAKGFLRIERYFSFFSSFTNIK